MGHFTPQARKAALKTRAQNNALRAKGLMPAIKRVRAKNTGGFVAPNAPLNTPQAVDVTPKYEAVTPAKAQAWLDHNKSNRTLTTGLAEKYARDMKEGRWTTCIDPIAFYADGDVANGQHRLWAIIISDTTQKFLVLRGLDRPSGLNVDMQRPRTLIDNASIAGVDKDLSYTLLSLCRGIEQGDRSSKYLTNTDKLSFVAKHREAATFALKHGGRGKLMNNAIINGAVARAWYVEEDKERLAHFGTVLTKGFAEGEQDSAAIALRNYLLTQGATRLDSAAWKDTFTKAQNAIWYFMRKRRLMLVKRVSEERYPLKGVKK